MIEYQTLITFRQTDNTMGVKTYNITKYEPISEGPIKYETSDLVTEFADGVVRMLRKVKLPKGTTMVNPVADGGKGHGWCAPEGQFQAFEVDGEGGSPHKNNFLGFIVAVILCTDLGGICGRAQLFHTATTPSGDLNLQLEDFVSADVSYSFSLSILISSIRFVRVLLIEESGDGNHLPRSTCDFIVTTQASKDPPSNMQLKDKFLIQTTVAPMVVWMRTSFQVFSEKKLAAYPIVTVKSELIKEVLMARETSVSNYQETCMVYLHVSCQILGYDIGVSGWTTGLALGNKSKGIVHTTHRNIGITLFTLCTLQVDNHEFWFMGFLNYNIAVHHMYEALRYMQKEASPQR
ncbi:hypothetical protein ZIOFF_002799 [Zingiber officinale]|uniref:AIR12 DOMON domain-containing protein n=1 Tax=Zingiber officinale TaxID=94328 RepID=A0A8J5LT03_ZINOF|nr:hypothetical protein ZIOFF_002799 [Zingiber officinale]